MIIVYFVVAGLLIWAVLGVVTSRKPTSANDNAAEQKGKPRRTAEPSASEQWTGERYDGPWITDQGRAAREQAERERKERERAEFARTMEEGRQRIAENYRRAAEALDEAVRGKEPEQIPLAGSVAETQHIIASVISHHRGGDWKKDLDLNGDE